MITTGKKRKTGKESSFWSFEGSLELKRQAMFLSWSRAALALTVELFWALLRF